MESKKRGSGSFCIPRKAIDKLLQTGDQARWLIPAYLKLAAHTDATGVYSTAGHTAIRRTLKRNKDDAIRFTDALCKMRLIYKPEQWKKKTGEAFPDDVPERQKVRFVINTLKEDQTDMVWFSRGLVDGVGDFSNPLRRLADCGSEGARMFLYLYGQYDAESFHACNPLTTAYMKYIPASQGLATNYMVKEWRNGNSFMQGPVLNKVFPHLQKWDQLNDDEAWQERGSHWDAIRNLEAAGFIYEVAAVVSTPIKVKSKNTDWSYEDGEAIPDTQKEWDYSDMENMSVVYMLANKDRFSSDTGKLHEAIKQTVELMGGHADYDRVYSIMPTGMNNSVMGLYKPRFIPDNTRNAFVAEGMNNQRQEQSQAMQWLHHFNKTKRLSNDGIH